MISKILLPIPPQKFELIRNRIAEILYIEIENQWVLSYDADLIIPVWVERTVPYDHNEAPCINVNLANGNYDNKDATIVDGTYQYNIDCYTKAKANGVDGGDKLATIKLHRLLGVCRAILENQAYFNLAFDQPYIGHTEVSSLSIAEPGNKDADHVMMGRLTFTVRAPETSELKEANLIEGYDTSVKLLLTDKGYVFSGDNPYIPPDTCEPVTITINGVDYDVVASGTTKDIIMQYESGAEVPWTNDYGIVVIPDPGGSADWSELWP